MIAAQAAFAHNSWGLLIKSMWDSDLNILKIPKSFLYFHHVLAVQKREISLPVGLKPREERNWG